MCASKRSTQRIGTRKNIEQKHDLKHTCWTTDLCDWLQIDGISAKYAIFIVFCQINSFLRNELFASKIADEALARKLWAMTHSAWHIRTQMCKLQNLSKRFTRQVQYLTRYVHAMNNSNLYVYLMWLSAQKAAQTCRTIITGKSKNWSERPFILAQTR